MAQLVARLVRNEKVRGSNPLSSTKMLKPQVYPGASTFYKLRDSNPGGLAPGGIGVGARFFLPPKNSENVATFSEFL